MKTIVIAMLIGFFTPAQSKGEMLLPVEIKTPVPTEIKLKKK